MSELADLVNNMPNLKVEPAKSTTICDICKQEIVKGENRVLETEIYFGHRARHYSHLRCWCVREGIPIPETTLRKEDSRFTIEAEEQEETKLMEERSRWVKVSPD